MKVVFLFLGLIAGLAQGRFVPPADGPVPFGRDRLPLDVDTMTALSRHVMILSGALGTDTPEKRRTLSQMIALALALDPANRQAVRLATVLQQGGAPPPADPKALGRAESRAWNLLSWLETPEAGADGQALAACLGDVLVAAAPAHPGAEARAGERGAWDGWVAPTGEFIDKPVEMPVKPPATPLIALKDATVRVPLWIRNPEAGASGPEVRPVVMKARIQKDASDFAIVTTHKALAAQFPEIGAVLRRLLESRERSLPPGLRISLELPGDLDVANAANLGVIRAAALVLADSALSGSEPAAVVFAAIDPAGKAVLPPRFWQVLRSLAASESGRLVLSAEAARFLPALVTLDRSEWFMEQQVVLARDANELCMLVSSSPPPQVAEALAAFENLKSGRNGRNLGTFVTLPGTQQRLSQIVSAMPGHASARMLALRGTSRWPSRLERELFAREIRAAIAPMGDLLERPVNTLTAENVQGAQESCRERLAALEKLAGSIDDRDQLYAPVMNTVKSLGGLAADLKRGEALTPAQLQGKLAEVRSTYFVEVARLSKVAGDAADYPVPDPPARQ